MPYLEKSNWKKIKSKKGNHGTKGSNLWINIRSFAFIAIAFLGVGILATQFWSPAGTYYNPYKGVVGLAYAAPPGKPLDFRITKKKNFKNPVMGIFPLGNSVSIVAEGQGEKIGTTLEPIRFAAYNVGREYLNYPATDWIYMSRMVKAGKKMTEVLGGENLAMAFQVVPFRQFKSVSKKVVGSPHTMTEPCLALAGMQGLEQGFDRIFADGYVREIKPNANWLTIRPNTQRLWRKSQVDIEIGVPSLEPEEALPVAFYVFTDLCDWKTGQWNVPATQWLASRQYAISYGIYIEPEEIKIVGKGLNTRFVYEKELEVDMVIVRWSRNQTKPKYQPSEHDVVMDVPVPVVNDRNELCFWGSREPDQSIVIPYPYLPSLGLDDPILLGEGSIRLTFQDMLDELQLVRENRQRTGQHIFAETNGTRSTIDHNYSAYLVSTPRLTEIIDTVIADAQTTEDAVKLWMAFIAANLPYVSDHKGNKNKPGYNGPMEIPQPPLLALMNRGEDCEGHAIFAGSGYVSSKHLTLAKINHTVALAALDYSGIGHLVPLLPLFDAVKYETDPFPNHVVLPFDGEPVPYAYTEPTGFGYNDLHQDMPTKRGYRPEYIIWIQGNGPTRQTAVLGFNQFQYLQEEG